MVTNSLSHWRPGEPVLPEHAPHKHTRTRVGKKGYLREDRDFLLDVLNLILGFLQIDDLDGHHLLRLVVVSAPESLTRPQASR